MVGSPIKEVYEKLEKKIKKNIILKNLKLTPKKYFLASIHREENVDKKENLAEVVKTFNSIVEKYKLPMIVVHIPEPLIV